MQFTLFFLLRLLIYAALFMSFKGLLDHVSPEIRTAVSLLAVIIAFPAVILMFTTAAFRFLCADQSEHRTTAILLECCLLAITPGASLMVFTPPPTHSSAWSPPPRVSSASTKTEHCEMGIPK